MLSSTAAAITAVDSSPYHEQQHASFNSTSTSTAYLAWMADSQIRHGMTKGFDYGTAVVYKGFERAISLTRNQTLVDFYHDQLSIVQDNGTITGYNYSYYSLDQYRIGMSLLYWYTHYDNTSQNSNNNTTKSKYAHAATLIRAMLDTHPRNPQGGFWHRSPTYPDQIWGDSIFMGTSFYALYTSVFEPHNTSAWDDVTLQYTLYYTHCLNLNNNNNSNDDVNTNGTQTNNTTKTKTSNNRLLKHGYDASKRAIWANPITGASPLVWARADGWFFTSLLETLQVIPPTHPGYTTLLKYFQSLAEGLLVAQQQQQQGNDDDSTTGGFGWWLIMDEEYIGVEGNYIESSATAMFTNGFLEGVRLGFLDAEGFLEPAKRAYRMMVEKWVVVVVVGSNNGTDAADEGTLDWEGTVEVGSLGSNATFQYYTSEPVDENDYKGIGPFMWASYEYELLESRECLS